MAYANLTAVQIGMTGTFADKRYRVAGRLVMSMEEAGETYWWNEFHLIADDGGCATLVHEQTEHGVEWRLFTMFEPVYPVSVAEAAAKQVGDTVNLTGTQLRVTCVDESRVCQIEGEPPEGVELGDVARYFNAESGHEMNVVSWTGNEIEFYRGLTLPAQVVMRAFGISGAQASVPQLSSDALPDAGKTIKGIIGIVVLLVAVALGWFWFSARGRSSKPAQVAKAQLAVGDVADVNGASYTISGHAVVEIAQVGRRYLRHEYAGQDVAGHEVLLVQGTEQGAGAWVLLTPFVPARSLTPREAGIQGLGRTVQLEDAPMKVTTLFLSRVQKTEGTATFTAGTALYGFVARDSKNTIVTRWDENSIRFYRADVTSEGKALSVRKTAR